MLSEGRQLQNRGRLLPPDHSLYAFQLTDLSDTISDVFKT